MSEKVEPIHELALTLAFNPIEDFSMMDFASVRDALHAEFPHFQQVQSLPPMTAVAPFIQTGPIQVAFTPAFIDTPRMMFFSADQATLVQLQPDRVSFNWRRVGEGLNPYPGFDVVLGLFVTQYSKVLDVLQGRLAAPILPTTLELAYIDQIENEVENGISKKRISEMFAFYKPSRGMVKLTAFNCSWFELIEGEYQGWCQVAASSPAVGLRGPGAQLATTVRLDVSGRDPATMTAWFDAAHERAIDVFKTTLI